MLLGSLALAFVALAGPEEKKNPVIETPPPYDWTGFYIGVNGGYAWDSGVEVRDLDMLNVGPPVQSFSFDADGGVGGIQTGYNWQAIELWHDPIWLVLGVEGDVGYLGLYGKALQPGSPAPGTFAKIINGVYSTARVRVGLARDRWLFYVTGGYFGSNYEREIRDNQICACGFKLGGGEDEDWESGWTAGGGVEWAFRDHWSLRVEYLYYDIGDRTVNARIIQTGNFRFGFDEDDGNIFRAGLNFKF